MAPQQYLFAASICSVSNPSQDSILKSGSLSSASVMPRVSRQNVSPSVHLLNTKRISNASERAFSSLSIVEVSKPFSLKVS